MAALGATSVNGGVSNKGLVLAAMVFAVAMTFIDQTIVAIAIPSLQKDLSLSATGSQWIINGYLLALSALFAFGGKLGDVLGRRRMVVIGVLGFAITSACCGLTPTGSIAQAWIITFRVLQGATAALLFPAAVAIVVASFPLRERGQGDGDLLRHLRRPDGDRPRGRRLPHAVDVARDLLDQHPRGDHRPRADLDLKARERAASHQARLPGHRVDHRRDGPDRARPPAVGACGAGAASQPGHRS